MELGLYTTKVQTQDGRIWDLGNREYPRTHYHPQAKPCPECFVINAWTEKVGGLAISPFKTAQMRFN